MATLPARPSLGGLRRARGDASAAADLAASVDAQLRLAQRLRDEDRARRTTSVAPPSKPVR